MSAVTLVSAVAPDEYLDRRRQEWLTFERAGLIRYDPMMRLVMIDARATAVVKAMSEAAR